MSKLTTTPIETGKIYSISELEVELKGKKPDKGYVAINDEGKIEKSEVWVNNLRFVYYNDALNKSELNCNDFTGDVKPNDLFTFDFEQGSVWTAKNRGIYDSDFKIPMEYENYIKRIRMKFPKKIQKNSVLKLSNTDYEYYYVIFEINNVIVHSKWGSEENIIPADSEIAILLRKKDESKMTLQDFITSGLKIEEID